MMSYITTEVGPLISNREPDGIPNQQHQNQSPASSNNNNNNNNNNNDDDVEKMICEYVESSSQLKICTKNSSHTKATDAKLDNDGTRAEATKAASRASSNDNSDQISENLNETDDVFMKTENQMHRFSGDETEKNICRKHKLSVKHETVIVSRMDGILNSSGEQSSLYKCHLCGKLGRNLEKLRRHLAAHSRKLPFRCSVCDVRFQLRPQLSFHMKTQHGNFWHGKDLGADNVDGAEQSEKCLQAQRVVNSTESANSRADICGSGASVDLSASSENEKAGSAINDRTDHVTEPPIKVSVCDSGIIKTRGDINAANSVSYSSGQNNYSAQDISVSSPQTYSSSANDFYSNSSLFTCRMNQNFLSKGLSSVHKVPANDHDDGSGVDTSKGMDMTCKSRSHVLGQGELQNKNSVDHSLTTRSVAVDLASRIRETEHLGDDITVVIPSDVPIDENEAKCENLRKCDESESTCQNKIIHAPHKSILGNSQLRTKRKLSASATTPTSLSADSVQKLIHASVAKNQADEFSGHHMAIVPGVSTGSLPLSVYNPLALSSFVQGFSGLMSSSLLSPIITQTPLGFPGMLVNPLTLYAAQLSSNSIASLMNSKVANMSGNASLNCGQRDMAQAGNVQTEALHLEALSDGGNRIKEELSSSSGNGCCSSTSDGYASPNSKCSSLSRTHSRLNVIQKPIKRENAYKPIVMSDGRTAYHCLYCNKNFCTISDVNRHMDFHEDIRPYKCRFCNYYARTNSQLKVHMMRHQGIRDFLCRLCNYKGVTQSDLNRHTKSQIHMMKERNVCTLCREGFVSPMNLEQHRIEKHLKMENCNDNGVKYHLTMAGLVKQNN